MNKSFTKILVALLGASGSDIFANPLTLGCPSLENDTPLIKKLASDIAKRENDQHLNIFIKGKVISFIDQPPYNEPLSGVHYSFCDRRGGFILIQIRDETVFNGKLINEETGQVTDAGQDVQISEDRRAYFATEQPDGLEGQNWRIYSTNGNLSWSGQSFFFLQNNSKHRYADLASPEWLPSGEISAVASCASDFQISWKVKLIKSSKYGDWVWRPLRKCPPNSN